MPSDANKSTVTLTSYHAWNGRKWVEQPAPPVTDNGPGWVSVAGTAWAPSPVFPTMEDALRAEIAVLRGTLVAVRDVVPPGWRAQIDEVLG